MEERKEVGDQQEPDTRLLRFNKEEDKREDDDEDEERRKRRQQRVLARYVKKYSKLKKVSERGSCENDSWKALSSLAVKNLDSNRQEVERLSQVIQRLS